MADLGPAWIALVGTIFGGAGLKLTETWLNRSAQKEDADLKMREELRGQISGLKEDLAKTKEEINKTEQEMDAWREKYWQLRSEYVQLKAELSMALESLRRQSLDSGSKNVVDSPASEDGS